MTAGSRRLTLEFFLPAVVRPRRGDRPMSRGPHHHRKIKIRFFCSLNNHLEPSLTGKTASGDAPVVTSLRDRRRAPGAAAPRVLALIGAGCMALVALDAATLERGAERRCSTTGETTEKLAETSRTHREESVSRREGICWRRRPDWRPDGHRSGGLLEACGGPRDAGEGERAAGRRSSGRSPAIRQRDGAILGSSLAERVG